MAYKANPFSASFHQKRHVVSEYMGYFENIFAQANKFSK